jgi:hypothetical protein
MIIWRFIWPVQVAGKVRESFTQEHDEEGEAPLENSSTPARSERGLNAARLARPNSEKMQYVVHI